MAQKKVNIYTWPHCPYCKRAKRLLNELGIPFTDHNIWLNADEKDALIEKTGQTTVPYIFIGNAFIGGFEELNALYRDGHLGEFL